MLTIWKNSRVLAICAACAVGGVMATGGWAQQAERQAAAAAADAEKAAHAAMLQAELQAKHAADVARHAVVAAGAPDAADGVARAYVWSNRKGKKEKAAFLGVTTIAAGAALRDQLKLPRGIGLVVQSVEENSPAAAAGFVEHDILTKIDDQWLVNAPQFGVVVRMHKPGEEINVTLIRQGQSQTVKAKLAEKEMYIANDDGAAGATMFTPGQGAVTLDMPHVNVQGLEKFQNFGGWKALVDDDDADILIKENDRTMKIKMRNGEKHLVVTDNEDKVLFEGPIETDEQRKALPADIAGELDKYKDQIDQLKDGGGGGQRKKIRIIKDGR